MHFKGNNMKHTHTNFPANEDLQLFSKPSTQSRNKIQQLQTLEDFQIGSDIW